MLIKPKVIDRRKILPPEAAESASWRVSPQTVRLWKSKDHARRMMVLGKTIARAESKNAPIMAALARDAPLRRPAPPLEAAAPDEADLRAMLLNPSQAAAIGNIQGLAAEIKRLADLINQQNVVFSLGQDMLRLSELSAYLAELDEAIGKSRYAARRLGVSAVADDLKTGGFNGSNEKGRAA